VHLGYPIGDYGFQLTLHADLIILFDLLLSFFISILACISFRTSHSWDFSPIADEFSLSVPFCFQ
jgi:hypothetical protein